MRAREFILESIRFTIDPSYSEYYDSDEIRDMRYANIDVNKVDSMWRTDDRYIGSGGKGGIGDRYDRFGEWLLTTHEPVLAPSLGITQDGSVEFNNGRHRFAWFRDHGYRSIPVSMDEKSYKLAKHFGILR